MKTMPEKILHNLVLIALTIFCFGVMWKLSAKENISRKDQSTRTRSLPPIVAPKAPIVIQPLHEQLCEITNTYAGKIQPWEKYKVGFALGGRIVSLGTNAAGDPLDEGDQVQAGDVLAIMDDRVFLAQKSEAAARIEQATSELQRADKIRQTQPAALTASEHDRLITDLALAKAQHEIALKNLDDATLRSPVAATISKRMIKTGESVNPNQIVFELVENNDVLLVVDVPESHIRELEERMRAVQQMLSQNQPGTPPPENSVFRAHVHLEGRDRFGNPWPTLDGEVYHIPEISDERTGLFPLEIRLSNSQRLLRPGMVATADVVTARLPGYRIPEAAILFRQRTAHLFSVTKEPATMEMLYWEFDDTFLYRARRVPLARWIDQGDHVFIPAEEAQLSSVVVRGQYRLADKQLVRIVNLHDFSPGELQIDVPEAITDTTETEATRVDVAKGSIE
ncbi:MAG: hypothetical protein CMJ72_13790 [Planctomycetaceae bacterium]|nr:hypothetical protein [Planctomycetaceae bacterium]HCK40913.1 hypothetical protein [Planctomycetaceae bacterium]